MLIFFRKNFKWTEQPKLQLIRGLLLFSANIFNCLVAAGRFKSRPTNNDFLLNSLFKKPAIFAAVVVLPAPCSPAKTITDKDALDKLILDSSESKKITNSIKIPTIGIGSSSFCDGQILVTDDLLGLSGFYPRFVKKYANLQKIIKTAIKKFKKDVRNEKFPSNSNTF